MVSPQRGATSPPFVDCLQNGSASVSSASLSPNPLHAISSRRRCCRLCLSAPFSSILQGRQHHVPGLPSAHCFSPRQLTPRKTHISCHQAKPYSKSCGVSCALCLSCLVLLNAVPLGHWAETCRETSTQINLEHSCGGEKQLYQTENYKGPVITL